MRYAVLVASCLLLLSQGACVTESGFAYDGSQWDKQGAGEADFERDLASCQQQVSEPTETEDCLRELGWSRFGDRSATDRARETLPSY